VLGLGIGGGLICDSCPEAGRSCGESLVWIGGSEVTQLCFKDHAYTSQELFGLVGGIWELGYDHVGDTVLN
jgi:hypothetical protein